MTHQSKEMLDDKLLEEIYEYSHDPALIEATQVTGGVTAAGATLVAGAPLVISNPNPAAVSALGIAAGQAYEYGYEHGDNVMIPLGVTGHYIAYETQNFAHDLFSEAKEFASGIYNDAKELASETYDFSVEFANDAKDVVSDAYNFSIEAKNDVYEVIINIFSEPDSSSPQSNTFTEPANDGFLAADIPTQILYNEPLPAIEETKEANNENEMQDSAELAESLSSQSKNEVFDSSNSTDIFTSAFTNSFNEEDSNVQSDFSLFDSSLSYDGNNSDAGEE